MSSSVDCSEDEEYFNVCEQDDSQYFNLNPETDNKENAKDIELYEYYTLKPKQVLEEMMSHIYDVIEM